jgi:iron complex outermembrane receptor protein
MCLSLLPLTVMSTAVAQEADTAAQSAPVSNRENIEEITVTARRKEESLQEVPVSISVFRDSALERAAISNVADLANFTPNMTFTAGENGRLAAPVIRGLGVIDTRGFDNSVGVFVDGIYVSGRAAQNVGMLDLDRVEVVRGPQSALYGRNTFAGAINYITRGPTDTFEARAEGTAGTDDLYRLQGSISGPLGNGFTARLAALYEDDGGTYENAGPAARGGGIGGQEVKTVHGRLAYDAGGPWSFGLSAFYSEDHGDSRALSRVGNNCGQLDPAKVRNLPTYDANSPAYYCGQVPPAGTDELGISPAAYAWDGETSRIAFSAARESESGYIAQMNVSYTDSENSSRTDLDGTQAGEPHYGYISKALYQQFGRPPLLLSGVIPFQAANFNTYISNPGLDQQYVSTEFRLSSPVQERLRWSAGAFYFWNENKDRSLLGIDASAAVAALGLPTQDIQFLLTDPGVFINPFLTPRGIAVPQFLPNSVFIDGVGTSVLTAYDLEVEQIAAFGSVEFDFTDRLTGTAEARVTHETQDVKNLVDLLTPPQPQPTSEFDSSSDYFDPRFILRYTLSDSLMFYGSAAHGTRSGGINPLVRVPEFVAFDEETNWTYEMGVKSTITADSGDRLLLNASVFYVDWKDAQFRQRLSAAPGAFLTATTNATGITSKGFELEAAASISERIFINAGFGYADASFDDGTYSTGNTRLCDMKSAASSSFAPIPVECIQLDLDGNGVIDTTAPDLSGNQLRRTAKYTANLGVQYMAPLFGSTQWVARIDAAYRSKMYTDLENLQWTPSRTVANARLGLEAPRYDIYLWVENLTDEDTIESTNTFNSDLNSFNYVTTAVNVPLRRYGLTGRYRW